MKKILIFRNSKLGDYLISLPSIKLIKEKYKKCDIYYLTSKSKYYKYLPKKIEGTKFVDKFIYFENDTIEYLKLLYKIKKLRFDVVYNLQETTTFIREFKNYLFFIFTGIKKKEGFFQNKMNYKKFNETYQIAKRVNKNLKKRKIFNLSKLCQKNEKKLIKSNYISISIGGFSQPNLWKIEKWKKLCQKFISKYNLNIVITGTKEDINNGKLLANINKKKIHNYCGKLNINQLFNIIKFSELHITNDNGSMHVATIYNKKTICLFNNHDPEGKWFPANHKAKIFRSKKGVNNIKAETVLNFISNFI